MKKIIEIFHFLLFNIFVFIRTIIAIIQSWFCVIFFSKEKSPQCITSIMRSWSKHIVFFSFCKIIVHNQHYLKNLESPYLLIANHQSFFDIFACSGFLPSYFVYLAKKDIFQIPLLGNIMKKAGCVVVSRDKNVSNIAMMKQIIKLLRNKRNILIYPEGTRNKNLPQISNFQKGVFQIASTCKVSIIPITLHNIDKIFLQKFRIARKKIQIDILQPILIDSKYHPANNRSSLSLEEKMSFLRDTMQESYNKLEGI